MSLRRREVRSLVAAHQPADAVEAGFRDRMIGLLDGAGDPFSRHRYDPGHFTASAFVISPDGGSLLLVHHRKIGLWVQPGGHVDPADASPQEAARREAEEEAGVTGLQSVSAALFDVDVHEFPAHGDQPDHLHFDLRFLFRTRLPDLRPAPEVAGAEWVRFDDVASVSAGAALGRAVLKLTS